MDTQLTTWKKVLFSAIVVVIILAAVEALSYFLLHKVIPSRVRYRSEFRSPQDYVAAHRKAMEAKRPSGWFNVANRGQRNGMALKMFHPVLGWDYPPDSEYKDGQGVRYHHGSRGERRSCTDFDTDLIATYGDSFVYCSDEEDCRSWQTVLARRIGSNVLNFGVGGYGTDQAYLKYELNAAGVWTPVVILGILPDNINRVVNVFRTFYAPSGFLALTKPRYVYESGVFRLLPNPLASAQDAAQFEDPQFVRRLGENDYWYNKDMTLPRLGFPYSLSLVFWRGILLEHFLFQLNLPGTRFADHFYPGNLFEEPEPLAIMNHIVDLFVKKAGERNSKPVILIMAHKELVRETMTHKVSRVENLVKHLREKNYQFLDLIQAQAEMKPSEQQLDQWYKEHATPEGNKITAGLIADYLNKEGLVPEQPR